MMHFTCTRILHFSLLLLFFVFFFHNLCLNLAVSLEIYQVERGSIVVKNIISGGRLVQVLLCHLLAG